MKIFMVILCTIVIYVQSENLDIKSAESLTRNTRALTINKPNKNYQACITPNGTPGHCKHIQHCVQADFKNSFLRILDFFCIIERSSIGVCCPNEISEKAGPNFSNRLPSLGDDEEMPVWGFAGDEELIEDPEPIVNKPEERGCGLATKVFPKITGGRPADPGEWPWMAALLARGIYESYCGGVLITDRHVLTAAHCTIKFEIKDLFVRLGEYDFTQYNETRSRDFRVIDIRNHEDFDRTTYENDIAVIKLHAPTIFNSYIWPVCMPPIGETWEGYTAIITGWGTQSFGGPASDVLMEVNVPIWSQQACEKAFVQRITDQFICAGAFEGRKDSCQGDSGGPLLVQLPNQRWVTVGIVSWGVRCGEPNHPGVYTRVSSYTNWVIKNSVF